MYEYLFNRVSLINRVLANILNLQITKTQKQIKATLKDGSIDGYDIKYNFNTLNKILYVDAKIYHDNTLIAKLSIVAPPKNNIVFSKK